MDIKNITGNALDPYKTQMDSSSTVQGARGRQSDAAASKQATGDRVSVSPEARLRTEALVTAMNTPDVRQDKIDALKERIASGTYEIDSRSIARGLLQSEALLADSLKE